MGSDETGLKDWAKWFLFFSSYFPLYVIIAVKTRATSYDLLFFETPVFTVGGYEISFVAAILLAFGFWVLAFLYLTVRLKRAENGQQKRVGKPDERNELVITYILVHVVPFAFIDYSSLLNFLAFSLLFISIGIIQVRSSHLYVNPILSAMRYDLYEIEDADTRGQMLLVKTYEDTDSDDSTVTAVELSNEVYISTS